MVAVSLLSLAGCGKKLENQIIGSWQMTDKETGQPAIFVYRKGGEGIAKTVIGEINFKWEVADAGKGIITRSASFLGEDGKAERQITIDGDKLIERDPEDNEVTEYVRVADDAEVPKVDVAKEMQKSEEESDAAKGKITPTALRNATEDDKKFIEMYGKAIEHLNNVREIFKKAAFQSIEQVDREAQSEFDAAWNLQVNHFGTPPRFNEANSKLRSALLAYKSGLRNYPGEQGRRELEDARKFMEESVAAFEAQMTALYHGR